MKMGFPGNSGKSQNVPLAVDSRVVLESRNCQQGRFVLLARGNSKFKGGAQGTSPNKNCMRRVFFREGKARFS
jgi:hypothetical protein